MLLSLKTITTPVTLSITGFAFRVMQRKVFAEGLSFSKTQKKSSRYEKMKKKLREHNKLNCLMNQKGKVDKTMYLEKQNEPLCKVLIKNVNEK